MGFAGSSACTGSVLGDTEKRSAKPGTAAMRSRFALT
jgi:hypothetical protein